jgi:uncharacterized protein
MAASEVSNLYAQVLWAGFALSAIFGAIAQRTHFCTMGAVSDVMNMGDWSRMRQWAMAAGVAMIGWGMLAHLGVVDPAKTLYSSTRWLWLSASLGGALFGFGMVLASGCGSKTLVRIGSGNLKSVVVFVVLAAAAFATLKGITAVVRVATLDRVGMDMQGGTMLSQALVSVTGWSMGKAALLAGLAVGSALLAWALKSAEFRTFDNLLAGVGIGATVVGAWWISAGFGHLAEHPETLQEAFLATNSGRAEALSFVAPVAYTMDWFLFFSDQSKVLTLGVVSVAGVVLGSWLCAMAQRSFRWEGFGGTEDLANHLVGACLMGVGGVTAMGCTIGQGLSGISTLSATSLIAVCGILTGAVAALKYQVWRLEHLG